MKKISSIFLQALLIIALFMNIAYSQDKPETDFDAPYLITAADSLFKAREYDEAREWYMQAAEKAEEKALRASLPRPMR